jgi:hypothetical protein
LAKDNLTEEVENKLLLATDEGRTVFQVAAKNYEVKVFQG